MHIIILLCREMSRGDGEKEVRRNIYGILTHGTKNRPGCGLAPVRLITAHSLPAVAASVGDDRR